MNNRKWLSAVEGNDEEIDGFVAINEGMQQGFAATFDKLDIYLGKNQAKFAVAT